MIEMTYERAKAAHDALRPGEIQKFKNVDVAWMAAKAECAEGEEPTQEAVRQKLQGKSTGTLLKYLPIVLGLQRGENSQQLSDANVISGLDDVTTSGTRQINAAIAAFVSDIEGYIQKSTATDSVRLNTIIVANNEILQKEVNLREQAEANVNALTSECSERADEFEKLQKEHAEILGSKELLVQELVSARREIDLEKEKNRTSQDQIVILNTTLIGLREDVDNFRKEREQNNQRAADAEKAHAASEAIRKEDVVAHHQQLIEQQSKHAVEIEKVRTRCDAEILVERDRNTELGLALVAALKPLGNQITNHEGDAA